MNHMLDRVRRLPPSMLRSPWRQCAARKIRRLRAAAPAATLDPMALLESAVQALWREAQQAGRRGLGIEVSADAGQVLINVGYAESAPAI